MIKHDSENAEIGVCAAMLFGGRDTVDIAQSIVSEDDFANRSGWGALFAMLCDLTDAGASIQDTTLVVTRAKACGVYDAIGGSVGFVRLSKGGTAANVVRYASEVREQAIKRKLRESLALRLAQLDELTAANVRNALEADLTGIDARLRAEHHRRTIGQSYRDLQTLIHNARPENKPKILTGYPALDRKQGGLRRGALHVIAARPSDGKTSLALNIAEQMAEMKFHVLFASMEMSIIEVAERSLAHRAGVNAKVISNRLMQDWQRDKVDAAVEAFGDIPLTIYDASGMTVSQLRGIAKVQKNETGLDAMFVDYLSLIERERGDKATEYQHYTSAVRSLRLLARELDIALVLLCQLNRQAESGKPEARPRLSHLRETGAIEQDAHTVTFIHRERPDMEDCELYFAKWRDGERGWSLPMRFDAKATRFNELATEDHPNYNHDLPNDSVYADYPE